MCRIATQTYSTFSGINQYGYSDPTARVLDKVAREMWEAELPRIKQELADRKAREKAAAEKRNTVTPGHKPVYRLTWSAAW